MLSEISRYGSAGRVWTETDGACRINCRFPAQLDRRPVEGGMIFYVCNGAWLRFEWKRSGTPKHEEQTAKVLRTTHQLEACENESEGPVTVDYLRRSPPRAQNLGTWTKGELN